MDDETFEMRLYLRDAAVCVVPVLRGDQLERITAELLRLNPALLVRRLTDNTFLVERIPVYARSIRNAESLTWELVASRVRRALTARPADRGTDITSIDVRDPSSILI
jgi:hypothetical protein